MKNDRFYKIRPIMEEAFQDGNLDDAKKLALEYLELAKSRKLDWNYGNAIHHANLILGRIALKQDLKEDAKIFLLKAGQISGSPQLKTFGPNMSLAKEMLAIGEKEIVIKYLELCDIFWKPFFSKTKKWKNEIEAGNIPSFGGNLKY